MKAVICPRVSTEQQSEGTSIETQERVCVRKAVELGAQVVAIYTDLSTGANYLTREGIQQALADIEGGKADVLIVYSISRLGRDAEHLQNIRKRVKAAGATLVICDMPIEDTPEGDLMFGISGNFAEYERQLIKSRTTSGRKQRALQGVQPCRGQSAFGYKLVSMPDVIRGEYPLSAIGVYYLADTSSIALQIFTWYAGGDSLSAIAKKLNASGVPTPANGRTWRPQTLRSIISNPLYKGKAGFGRTVITHNESRKLQGLKTDVIKRSTDESKWITIPAPAIVSEELWNSCQKALVSNKTAKVGPRRKYALSGLMLCPECGRRLCARVQASGVIFRCNVAEREKVHKVKAYYHSTIEKLVVAAIQYIASKPEALVAAVEAYTRYHSTPETDTASIEHELSTLDRKERSVIQAQIAGIEQGASPTSYAPMFAEIKARRVSLAEKLEEAQKVKKILVAEEDQIKSVMQSLETVMSSTLITGMEKQELLSKMIEWIKPGNKEITVQLKERLVGFDQPMLFCCHAM